jgi:small-conductance mechanosensitive channel
MRLPAYLDPVLSLVVGLWFIGAVSWMCLAAVEILSEWILSRYDLASKNNLEARKIYTQLRVLKRIIDVVILIIAVSCVLMSFERIRQLGVSLLASAGVVGIILGFAAQRSIATLFAGLQIAITQPIRLDDVVIVENEWGWIEEITLTHVVVKIWDLRRLVVPITYFIERPFQNWTRISADILGTVFLYADYKVPVESLREELHRILKSTPLWDQKAWCLQVTNVTADTVELRALMSATNSPEAWDLRCLVREKLLAFLQKRHPEHLPRTRVELDRTPPAPGTPKNDPVPPSPPDASKTG